MRTVACAKKRATFCTRRTREQSPLIRGYADKVPDEGDASFKSLKCGGIQ